MELPSRSRCYIVSGFVLVNLAEIQIWCHKFFKFCWDQTNPFNAVKVLPGYVIALIWQSISHSCNHFVALSDKYRTVVHFLQQVMDTGFAVEEEQLDLANGRTYSAGMSFTFRLCTARARARKRAP